MEAKKSGLRGENEMRNLHYCNKECIFTYGVLRGKTPVYGITVGMK